MHTSNKYRHTNTHNVQQIHPCYSHKIFVKWMLWCISTLEGQSLSYRTALPTSYKLCMSVFFDTV